MVHSIVSARKHHRHLTMNNIFIEQLRQRLQKPLPGLQAQLEMSSRMRHEWEVRDDHRKGGVLSLFYPYQEKLHLVFMKRTQDGKVHGGQVSFPGGKMEPTDRNIVNTALREAEEELGIPAHEVDIIGKLTQLYILPSNFMVYPSVGYLPYRPSFQPSEEEVATIIEAPLEDLLSQKKEIIHIPVNEKLRIKAPAFKVNGYVIWGATAMMLNELLKVVRELD